MARANNNYTDQIRIRLTPEMKEAFLLSARLKALFQVKKQEDL